MPNVRITTNRGHPAEMEWAGAPALDSAGRLERSIEIPEEVYRRIERGVAAGHMEGDVALADESRFHWFLDR